MTISVAKIIQCKWEMNGTWVWSTGGMTLTGKLRFSKKNPLPLCPPQIPHGLAWDKTKAFKVSDQQLPA
jgi:hypothetical protein